MTVGSCRFKSPQPSLRSVASFGLRQPWVETHRSLWLSILPPCHLDWVHTSLLSQSSNATTQFINEEMEDLSATLAPCCCCCPQIQQPKSTTAVAELTECSFHSVLLPCSVAWASSPFVDSQPPEGRTEAGSFVTSRTLLKTEISLPESQIQPSGQHDLPHKAAEMAPRVRINGNN